VCAPKEVARPRRRKQVAEYLVVMLCGIVVVLCVCLEVLDPGGENNTSGEVESPVVLKALSYSNVTEWYQGGGSCGSLLAMYGQKFW